MTLLKQSKKFPDKQKIGDVASHYKTLSLFLSIFLLYVYNSEVCIALPGEVLVLLA